MFQRVSQITSRYGGRQGQTSLTDIREQSAVDKMTVFKSIFAYVHDGTLVYKHHTSCLIMNDVIIIQCYAHVKFRTSNVIFVQERHWNGTLCILSSPLSCIVKGLLHPKMKMLSLITCHCHSKPVKWGKGLMTTFSFRGGVTL